MINREKVSKYCNDDISLIENYDKAMSDDTQVWHCHHRGEILPCGRYSYKTLKKYGLYYKRPASELIFMLGCDHISMHKKGSFHSEESKRKISENNWMRGKHWSEEHNRRVSEALIGIPRPDEVRRKISEGKKGKTFSEEHRRNLSKALKGRPPPNKGKKISEETRRKLSESHKGKHPSKETLLKRSESLKRAWAKKKGLA